jgi:hypothetical protein
VTRKSGRVGVAGPSCGSASALPAVARTVLAIDMVSEFDTQRIRHKPGEMPRGSRNLNSSGMVHVLNPASLCLRLKDHWAAPNAGLRCRSRQAHFIRRGSSCAVRGIAVATAVPSSGRLSPSLRPISYRRGRSLMGHCHSSGIQSGLG